MFFRSSNSDASVKEPSRTLNLFLKPVHAWIARDDIFRKTMVISVHSQA